ncbi:MAG: MraY family glycosyltransferase [Chloroflexota bacterium]
MAERIAPFLITFAVAFLLAVTLTPVIRRLAQRHEITAEPGGRRKHGRRIAKLGGTAIFIAFNVAVILAQFLPVERMDAKEGTRLIGLLLGGLILFVVGVLDDKRELGPWAQLIVQLAAASVAVGFLIHIEFFNNPLTGEWTPKFPYVVTVLVSLVWLLGMTNTVNWLDGLDGLAAGVTAIASLVLFINAAFRLDPSQDSVALLPVALLGATLGFLPYNFAPASVFIGGSALWLGFTLGSLSIIGGAKMASVLLVMGGPIVDVAWQIVYRLRTGKDPTRGDRGHLHFRLFDRGWSQRRIVSYYYLFCAVFGTLTLVVSSRIFKLTALGVLAAVVIVTLVILTRDDKVADI